MEKGTCVINVEHNWIRKLLDITLAEQICVTATKKTQQDSITGGQTQRNNMFCVNPTKKFNVIKVDEVLCYQQLQRHFNKAG